MKEVKAIIQPFMLDAVLDALHEIEGLPGIIVSEARAINVGQGHYEQIVKVKLEIIVSETLVEPVVQTIRQHAHTGKPGDGRIFVIPIEKSISIRTGEHAPPQEAM